ncbi:hypothetical protein [uncultured Sulfitobacter sp.]|uniref:hypothetical protein n=1 Tax=uncultured Sulfitobacter sp. TaxID=191468 RepID=UPI002627607B|nr:hypothetical protein [uncultured Sulfitobacter sp.]
MAFLSPKTLTCPACGHTGPLTWVTGRPLQGPQGSDTGYVKVQRKGDWMVEQTQAETIITCPSCQAEATRRSRTP